MSCMCIFCQHMIQIPELSAGHVRIVWLLLVADIPSVQCASCSGSSADCTVAAEDGMKIQCVLCAAQSFLCLVTSSRAPLRPTGSQTKSYSNTLTSLPPFQLCQTKMGVLSIKTLRKERVKGRVYLSMRSCHGVKEGLQGATG